MYCNKCGSYIPIPGVTKYLAAAEEAKSSLRTSGVVLLNWMR